MQDQMRAQRRSFSMVLVRRRVGFRRNSRNGCSRRDAVDSHAGDTGDIGDTINPLLYLRAVVEYAVGVKSRGA